MTKLADEINEFIKDKGWSQEQFATEADVHPSIISRILKGQEGMNLKTYQKITKVIAGDPTPCP